MKITRPKKTKFLWHRLIYSLLVIAVVLPSFFFLIPTPKASAAQQYQIDNANAICTGEIDVPVVTTPGAPTRSPEETKKRIEQCVKGYLAALEKNAPKPSSNIQDTSGPCFTKIYKNDQAAAFACQTGYRFGYNARGEGPPPADKPPTPQQQANAEAKTQCIKHAFDGDDILAEHLNDGDLLTACIVGYKNGKAGKDSKEACKSFPVTIKTNINNVYCQKGYRAAVAITAPGGDDQPSCEASGFNLSWIFCPFINGLADALDGIYSSIIQPLLVTKPIEIKNPAGDPTHTYQIWSNFRIYGDIVLVIILLVIVFGETIGGGIIDAYTAKKILPRLLIAAILINVSIYVVAFAVDVTNILGNGLEGLIEAPFKNAGAFKLQLNGLTSDLGVALIVGTGALVWGSGTLAVLAEFLFLFVLIPAFLIFLAIMVTLIIRQGLIILLVLAAPIAFAAYCLPNTERYFRSWWDLLWRTLLVYPLIAVFFAIANILSVTVNQLFGGITQSFADFIAITALFVPLLLIPFSFRIAGGLLGRLHEFASNAGKRGTEAIKGNANDPWSWRNRTKYKAGAGVSRFQQRLIDKGEQPGASRPRRAVSRAAGFGLFGNPDMRASKWNRLVNETEESMSATGRDNLRYAGAGYMIRAGEQALDGSSANHNRWFNSKGSEISKNMYDRAQRYFPGSTTHAVGGNLEYAFRKAQGSDDIAAARFAFAKNAQENDWNSNEMVDVWAQATFPHKDKWLSEWYSTPTPTDTKSGRGRGGVTFKDVSTDDTSFGKMMNEHYSVKSSYDSARFRAQDLHAMRDRAMATQTKLDAGQPIDNDEAIRYAQTHELVNGWVREAQATGQVQQNDEGEIVVSGAPAEAQGVISALSKGLRDYKVRAPDAGGNLNPATDRIIETNPTGQGVQPATVAIARNISPDRSNIERI